MNQRCKTMDSISSLLILYFEVIRKHEIKLKLRPKIRSIETTFILVHQMRNKIAKGYDKNEVQKSNLQFVRFMIDS